MDEKTFARIARKMRLLSLSNPKTRKGEKENHLTAILHLAPASLSGFNVCRYAGACKAPCLNTSGLGGIYKSIQDARVRKTRLLFEDRETFNAQLRADLELLRDSARSNSLDPCARLNGTSDLPWHRMKLGEDLSPMAAFAGSITFYDYSKAPIVSLIDWIKKIGLQYHITASLDAGEDSEKNALAALALGVSVAVPFALPRSAPMPDSWTFPTGERFRVIDGDVTDYRPGDPQGVLVGLRAKGKARKDLSGFVREVDLYGNREY